MTNILDLDSLSYADTAVYTVKHPTTGKPLGTITVAGPAHPQVMAYEEWLHRRTIEKSESYQRSVFEAVKAGQDAPPRPSDTLEELREVGAHRLASYVVSADFKIKLDGKERELNRDTALEIFRSPRFSWLAAGLSEFAGSRENFMGNSAEA